MRINKRERGITLIALVVTIIVLLILAGVSIFMLTGQNGILKRAVEAKEKTETAQQDEEEKMQGYESAIDQYIGKIPEGLKVGDKVTYSPSGTYNWQAKYCSTTLTEDVTLSSVKGESFNLTEWRVLSIENGKVELVPIKPTKGTVYLGQAQGYNNGVKLLNDACSSLYSNMSKGIIARSLNIEDIEKYMEPAKLAETREYQNTHGGAKYGNQLSSAYTNSNNFPAIYPKENLSVINGESKKTGGLERSEQTNFIEKNENGATDGKITTATSIQPYQTDWYKENSYMRTAFRVAADKINYYELLLPDEDSTNYWMASRCIDIISNGCGYYVQGVNNGDVCVSYMCDSNENIDNDTRALFPVVSLNASLLIKSADGEFSVNMD